MPSRFELSLHPKRCVAMAIGFAGIAILLSTRLRESPAGAAVRPDSRSLAAEISRSPADRDVLSRIAEQAFEVDLDPQTAETTWRLSAMTLRRIAPGWLAGKVRVVRAGLFHWPELSAKGRALLHEETAALLQDPVHFSELALPYYRLTGMVSLLVANAPMVPGAYRELMEMALSSGRFDHYRELQLNAPRHFTRLRERFVRERKGDELFKTLLEIPKSNATVPVIREYLRALEDLPATHGAVSSDRLTPFVEWALAQKIGSLSAIHRSIAGDAAIQPALQARVALASGNEEAAALIEAQSAATRSDQWLPFHLDAAERSLEKKSVPAAMSSLAKVPDAALTSFRVLAVRASIARVSGDTTLSADLEKERASKFGASSASRRWIGLCEKAMCGREAALEFTSTKAIEAAILLSNDADSSVGAWIELSDKSGVIASALVDETAELRATLRPGDHELKLQLLNPVTGTGTRRKITLVRSSFDPAPASAGVPRTPLRRSPQP